MREASVFKHVNKAAARERFDFEIVIRLEHGLLVPVDVALAYGVLGFGGGEACILERADESSA